MLPNFNHIMVFYPISFQNAWLTVNQMQEHHVGFFFFKVCPALQNGYGINITFKMSKYAIHIALFC